MTFKSDIWLLLWIGLVAFLSRAVKKRQVTVLGKTEYRYSILFAVIVFFPVFWFVSMGEIRSDVWAYISGFQNSNESVGYVIQHWNSFDKGPGFALLVALIKRFFGNDYRAFLVIVALLQSIPLVVNIRFLSEDYVLSIFLFITMMMYDGWMMNGLRQFLAACIAFAAFPLILKKKYIFAIPFVLVAISIHSSAIVMIPILILVEFKPWSKLSLIFLVIFGILLYFYVGHSDWMNEETLSQAKGLNPLRLVINLIPLVIAFWGRKQIAVADNRAINICVNMSIITFVMNIIAAFTSGMMTGRLAGYTGIYSLILFPYLCTKVFNEAVSKNIRLFIICFYVLHFFIYVIWG